MALTEAQWNRLQNSFPPEDRESYASYLDAIGEDAPTPTPTPTPTPASVDTTDERQQAILAARASALALEGLTPTPTPIVTGEPTRPAGTPKTYIYDATTKTWVKPPKPADSATNTYIWDDDKGWVATAIKGTKTVKAITYTGTGLNRKKVTTYSDDTSLTEDAPDSSGTGFGTGFGTGLGTGGFTQADINKAVQEALNASTKTATDAAAAAAKTTARKNMIEVLYSRFKAYGLETLAKKIEQLAIDGATEDTITIQLQESEEYKTRFKANGVRVKNDLKYLSPAEYLNLEDSYRQVLRAYGLKTFDNDAYVSQFIANDMSPTELSNRVVTAVQRVRNADPAVSKQLRDYYGIGQEDLVAYVLDPQQQFQKIERQVAASEIGVAAGRQGLTAGVTVAEQLAAQGVSMAEAQKGYATIADILPGAEKLSNIYGNTMDVYGQAEGEQEVFNSLASAQRKRQRLSATEAGTFGANAGMNRVSLTSGKAAGQI